VASLRVEGNVTMAGAKKARNKVQLRVAKKPKAPKVVVTAGSLRQPERQQWPLRQRLGAPARAVLSISEVEKLERRLLAKIKRRLPALRALLREAKGFLYYEDAVYRFYHQSFKVYRVQNVTLRIATALQELAPDTPLSQWFTEIVCEGVGKQWDPSHNRRWAYETRPILEAYFHARYFLEMVCRFGKELKGPSPMLPSGWAGVLYLYGWR
jgi:hypothetical protein